MLIAIILCLFSVAHSVPYFIRVDPSAELAPISAPISETPSFSAPPLPSGYVYNRLRYIPNPAYNVAYYTGSNNFNGGLQGSYVPRDQQEFQVLASQNATEAPPSAQQVRQFQVATNVGVSGQSVVDVNNVQQQQPYGFVPNVFLQSEIRNQAVGGVPNSVVDVYNVQQQQPYGFVSNVVAAPEIRNQAAGGVPNSYLPLIGYSQQQPVVGFPYARSSIDGQVVYNLGNRGVGYVG